MKQLWMDWQLFAEGESAPEGAGEGQDSTPPDAGEDFEALIRGRCKEEFDARVKKILDIELAMSTPNCKYTLGSVLSHVTLHQTVIGLEAEKQMEMAGEYPDMIIGCFGGGSNFGGICFPFMRHTILNGKQTRYIAAEPASCPKLTRGKFQYDFGDEAGYTPLLPMFTLGHNFSPANIHAGGLRYHGAGVIVSQLLKDNLMEAVDIQQLESFQAGCLFAQAEGIIPAPESCHAIAAAIREANQCKESGEEKTGLQMAYLVDGDGKGDFWMYDSSDSSFSPAEHTADFYQGFHLINPLFVFR